LLYPVELRTRKETVDFARKKTVSLLLLLLSGFVCKSSSPHAPNDSKENILTGIANPVLPKQRYPFDAQTTVPNPVGPKDLFLG
jgi:hypothetical protein